MNTLVTPPEALPILDPLTNSYKFPEIPGMVEITPGISYSVQLDGKPDESLFVAALQTKETLLQHPEGQEAVELLEKLSERVWGNVKKGIPPLYTIEGLKRNDRSAGRPDPNGDARYTGSFSLGTTVEKGHALGKNVPAQQPNDSLTLDIFQGLMLEVGRLYRLFSKRCLPKWEYDLIDFQAILNNLFSLGGLAPSAISLQLNVSSVTNLTNLIKHIGVLQGQWHNDGGDSIVIPTLFLLFLRLPEGSDPGPFHLGRLGLYCRPLGKGTWAVGLMFSARDMHSGSCPWIPEGAKHTEALVAFLSDISNAFPTADLITRVGMVLYQGTQMVERNAAICVSPETRFGNHGTLGTSMSKSLNFVQNGLHLLGSEKEAKTRLGWERVLDFCNGLHLDGLELGISVPDLISKVGFRDRNNNFQAIVNYPIDPSDSAQMEKVQLHKAYLKHLYILRRRYYIPLTKSHYLQKMKTLKLENSRSNAGISQFLPINSAVGTFDLERGVQGPCPVISQVRDHRYCYKTQRVGHSLFFFLIMGSFISTVVLACRDRRHRRV